MLRHERRKMRSARDTDARTDHPRGGPQVPSGGTATASAAQLAGAHRHPFLVPVFRIAMSIHVGFAPRRTFLRSATAAQLHDASPRAPPPRSLAHAQAREVR